MRMRRAGFHYDEDEGLIWKENENVNIYFNSFLKKLKIILISTIFRTKNR